MCRNIKPLFNFQPPVTEDEIRAASLQFVRKISGFSKPSQANVHFVNGVGKTARPPPLHHVLRLRPRLKYQFPRRIELARDDDLSVRHRSSLCHVIYLLQLLFFNSLALLNTDTKFCGVTKSRGNRVPQGGWLPTPNLSSEGAFGQPQGHGC